MAFNFGKVRNGHPYIDILLSPDSKASTKYTALIDTGFSGFISVPLIAANVLGFKAHTTARYTLANGRLSDPVPLAFGYACLEGDDFVQGVISISENTSVVVGVDFLLRCGKALLFSSKGVVMLDEADILNLNKPKK